MALHLSPELEQRLALLADNQKSDPHAFLEELVSRAEAEAEHRRTQIRAGSAQIDAGHGIPHEQAIERLRRAASGERPARNQ